MAEHLLSVNNLHKEFSGRVLFDGVCLGLSSGERLGLIGDNGTGKSTFLRLIAGRQSPDSGQIALRNGTRIGVLDQVPTFKQDTVQAVLEAPFAAVRQAIADFETKATLGEDTGDLLTDIDALGGWDWQHHTEREAQRVGLVDLTQSVKSLSGGQKKRLAVALMLLEKPDLVLLDEPTNHLDTETVEWLEQLIVGAKMTAIIVTHDRYFLEATVDRMAELRLGQMRTYLGSYTDYLVARAEEEALEARTDARRGQILKAEIDWARRSPKARTTKQQARLDRLDVAQAQMQAAPKKAKTAQLQMESGRRLGKTILELEAVSVCYADTPLFEPFSLSLTAGERWGIVGPNGAGKTSLLRLITEEVQPHSGVIKRGVNTEVAYFDQHRTALDPNKLVRDTLLPQGGDSVYLDGKPLHVSSYLNRFAFTPAAHTMRVAELSGGEKNRLALALFLLSRANVLLLDEPTNDLDLLTLSILEDALINFRGCIMVVSHDRYFLDKITTGIIGFESVEGCPAKIELVQGDWTFYQDRRTARAAAATAAAKNPPAAAPSKGAKTPTAPRKKLSFQEKKDLDGMETTIEAAERRVQALETQLADGVTWTGDVSEAKALQTKLQSAQAAVVQLYAQWEGLLKRQ
jgi:ATP-binding cassette subfamily F protein uup